MMKYKSNSSISFILAILAGVFAIIFANEGDTFFFAWEVIICLGLLGYVLYEKVI